MQTIIKLEEQDINTLKVGLNYSIRINEQLSIVFSPEAIEEFFKDINTIKEEELKEKK